MTLFINEKDETNNKGNDLGQNENKTNDDSAEKKEKVKDPTINIEQKLVGRESFKDKIKKYDERQTIENDGLSFVKTTGDKVKGGKSVFEQLKEEVKSEVSSRDVESLVQEEIKKSSLSVITKSIISKLIDFIEKINKKTTDKVVEEKEGKAKKESEKKDIQGEAQVVTTKEDKPLKVPVIEDNPSFSDFAKQDPIVKEKPSFVYSSTEEKEVGENKPFNVDRSTLDTGKQIGSTENKSSLAKALKDRLSSFEIGKSSQTKNIPNESMAQEEEPEDTPIPPGEQTSTMRALAGLRKDLATKSWKKRQAELKEEERIKKIISKAKIEKYKKKTEYKFPEDFLWGTSSSAYQTEGGIVHNWMVGGRLNVIDIYNDWSVWEVSEKRKRELIKKRMNLYDHICAMACDSYNRYADDLRIAASLNNNSVRFSVEWARIELKKNTFDVVTLNHYRDVMKEAKANGLKVVLTIWHWTNPLWITVEGGWSNKEIVGHFRDFTKLIVKELGGYVDYWVTLNEPMVHVSNGYIKGKFPPNKHNPFLAVKTFFNLVNAHKVAYNTIHEHFPNAKVSITQLVNHIEPARKWFLPEWLLAKILHYLWNASFLERIKDYMDYVGVDYYFHDRIVCYPPFLKNKNKNTSDMGWEIYPEGIYHVLKYVNKFKKPILVLENGVADKDDEFRSDFIKQHLYHVHRAIHEGVDVRGYFYWSLLDNYEWAEGYGPKFGLYSVDRRSFKREPRPSAVVYSQICKNNSIKI